MRYYKTTDESGKTVMIGSGTKVHPSQTEITQQEYESMLEEVNQYSAAVESYIKMVQDGEIALDEVPEEYREEVEAATQQTDPYTAGYDQAVLDMIESGVL